MVDTKVEDMTAASALDGTELLYAVQSSADRKSTVSQVSGSHGQCRLIKDGTNLKLTPWNGNKLIVNGRVCVVPDAGVTLASLTQTCTLTLANPCVITFNNHGMHANQVVAFSTTGVLPESIVAGTIYYVSANGLTTNTFRIKTYPTASDLSTSGESQSGTHTLYGPVQFIYATQSNDTINALEGSPQGVGYTTSTASSNKGVVIKSGDETRTLVGMAQWWYSGAWVDDSDQRLVRSWFNELGIAIGPVTHTGDVGQTSTSWAENGARAYALMWGGEQVLYTANGTVNHTTNQAAAAMDVLFDFVAGVQGYQYPTVPGAGYNIGVGASGARFPVEGALWTCLGGVTSSGTATFKGNMCAYSYVTVRRNM